MLHRSTVFLLLSCFMFSLYARNARRIGTISLKTTEISSATDLYGSRLNSEISGTSSGKTRILLEVTESFRENTITASDGKIIRRDGSILFIECPRNSIHRIAALSGIRRCTVSRKPFPLMDSVRTQCRVDEVHGTRQSVLPTHFTGKGVLTGILDTEFDTRHPAFLDSNGVTRFLAIWNQNDTTGAADNPFGYGTIKNRQELMADTVFGLGSGSHGTHTASTMAGSDRASGFYGVAPDGILIAVQYGGTIEITDGLEWIFSVADSLNLPCVINMSIGLSSGPHDGTSLVDKAIDSLSGPGRIIVGAAGNDGAKHTHVGATLTPNTSLKTWALPRIDSTDVDNKIAYTGIDFWSEPRQYFMTFLSILDRRTNQYKSTERHLSTEELTGFGEDTLLWPDSITGKTDTVFLQGGTEEANDRNRKTHLLVFSRITNPHLVLGIEIQNTLSKNVTVHGWNIAKESFHHFGIDGFVNGDSMYTINEIGGTAKRIITVGAYTGKTVIPLWNGTLFYHDNCTLGDIFLSSGVGPTTDGRIKPDITAPGWSIVAATSRNGSRNADEIAVWPDTATTFSRYGGATGTSMSSPVVAGIVALMLEANPKLEPEEAVAALTTTAKKDRFTGVLTTADNKWGAGKANALGAIGYLINVNKISRPLNSTTSSGITVMHSKDRIVFSSLPGDAVSIILTDLQGRSLVRKAISGLVSSELPTASLPAGIYSVIVYNRHHRCMLRSKIAILP